MCQISFPSVTGKVQKLHEKIYMFWAILRCVVDALSKSLCAGGRSESALVTSFI